MHAADLVALFHLRTQRKKPVEANAVIDVALVLALLAAFASVAFVQGAAPPSGDDPKETNRL